MLFWVNKADSKVVLLQQAVVIADMINEKLAFGLFLEEKNMLIRYKNMIEAYY